MGVALPKGLSGAMRAVGGLASMGLDAVKFIFVRPFQWREFLEQSWFVARVSLAPTMLVAIPFTVLVSFTLNTLSAPARGGGLVRCGRGLRCGDADWSDRDGADRGGGRRDGDVRGSGVAHHP